MNAKYIVIKSHEQEFMFTFPELIMHSDMSKAMQTLMDSPPYWPWPHDKSEIVSAGFVTPSGQCYGRSESLNVNSRPAEDTKLLQREAA